MPNSAYSEKDNLVRRSKSENVKMSRSRNQRLATIPGVREDAAQILDKFLQSKLAAQSKRAAGKGASYQAVTQVILTENDPQGQYKRTDSYRQASIDDVLHDAVDEDDGKFVNNDFRNKTASLPSDYKTKIVKEPGITVEDILLTPSKKKNSSKKHSGKKSLGKTGSISDSDTSDGEGGSVKKGRKKKSLFKRTKERLRQAFLKDETDVNKIIANQEKLNKKAKKPNKVKKKSKSKEEKEEEKRSKKEEERKKKEDLVAKVTTHTKTHIRQEVLHPNGKNDQPVIIRTEETTESVDIEDDVQMRHTKKQINVKESETGFGGVIGRLRKSFSRKSRKETTNIAESRSAEPVTSRLSLPGPRKVKGYQRTNSVPVSEALSCSQPGSYTLEQRKTFSSGDKKKVTDIFAEVLSRGADGVSTSDIETLESSSGRSREVLESGSISSSPSPTPHIVQFEAGPVPSRPVRNGGNPAGLDLNGLLVNRPKVHVAHESFDLDFECDRVDKFVRGPDGQVEQKSHISQDQNVTFPSNVSVDAGSDTTDNPGGSGDGKPFEQRTEDEKDQMYDVIARKLADIADNYAETDVESPTDELTPLEQQILDVLRSKGDQFNDSNFNSSPALQLMKNASYSAFQSTVQKAIGDNNNVKQIAILFHLTKRAVQIAGAGGALAVQIKENTLRYFEDKFAAWIVGQGGWDSMIEDTDSELD